MSATHHPHLVHLQCPQCQEIVRHLCGGHGAGRGPAGHTEALEEAGSLGDGDGGEIIEEENYHTAHEEVEWELDPAMVERFAKTAERLEKRRRDRRAEQQASRQSLSRAGKSKKKKKKQKKKRKSGMNAE